MLQLLQSLKISLLHTGYAKLDTAWNFDNVISPFTRLCYVTKGSATLYHNNRTYTLKEGHMYLIPSYVYNTYKCENYHEQFYISFFEEIRPGLSIYNLRSFRYEVPLKEGDHLFFERLTQMYPKRKIVNSDPKAYSHKPQKLLQFNKDNAQMNTQRYLETQGILTILLSRFIENEPATNANVSTGRLNDVLVYIAEHLNQSLEVQDLAKKYHMSTDHFSRLFLQQFNMRPLKYIQTKRIERAQLLLWTTNHSLEEIAHKIGMENFSYFSRTFKKITGTTPGKYRKNQAITP
ncbi:MAG: AraC family transcriptional regulator [Maribacter dokdonensis]|uniref:helix-turn-helix domain-containing protein n=1 Tax=Maribacter TaxID=252356 RepID=UPI000C0891E7|nr:MULTISPECIES: helix-turn-helix domain-containing protein [Maribacter]MDP2525068.1 AraC family transcriptional regulator [Maribacter dokdonensis]PHN92810.1 AraC family transcriptional regulator [Maribacter sp. 6B07]